MAFKEVTTTGPIEWAKLFEHNRDMEGYQGAYEDCDGGYEVNQILTKEEFEKLTSAGSMKKPNQKRLLDGELVVKFIRKHKVTNRNGELVQKASGAPKVTDADGIAWDGDNHPIGNGTIAELRHLISTFKVEGQPRARTSLVSVKILDYVPVPERDEEEEEAA